MTAEQISRALKALLAYAFICGAAVGVVLWWSLR